MKVKLIAIGLFLLFCSSFAQDVDKRGFIGLNIGTSYILNKQPKDAGVGANVNLLNFGYQIKNGFGISLKWMGGAHIYKTLNSQNEIGYGAILVGPMYSVVLSESVKLDCKIQSGIFWVEEKMTGGDFKGAFRSIGVKSLSAGLTMRYNFAKRWVCMLIADYNTGSAPGGLLSGERLHSVTLNAGIGFRI